MPPFNPFPTVLKPLCLNKDGVSTRHSQYDTEHNWATENARHDNARHDKAGKANERHENNASKLKLRLLIGCHSLQMPKEGVEIRVCHLHALT